MKENENCPTYSFSYTVDCQNLLSTRIVCQKMELIITGQELLTNKQLDFIIINNDANKVPYNVFNELIKMHNFYFNYTFELLLIYN
jgi:hypothetical protein